jgi:hypothetical protein
MKTYKRIFAAAMLALTLVPSGFTKIYAAENIRIFIDESELGFDAPPQIINGRTMVPVRVISEELGYGVEWVSRESGITIYHQVYTEQPLITLYIGRREASVFYESGFDGSLAENKVTLDSPPVLYEGRTLLPLRFIAETLRLTVEWDAAERIVRLYTQGYSPPASPDDLPVSAREMPEGILYTEEYEPPSGNGAGLGAYEAACKLSRSRLYDVYGDYIFAGPVSVTLVGLWDLDGEKFYVYDVYSSGLGKHSYCVGYSNGWENAPVYEIPFEIPDDVLKITRYEPEQN